MSRLARDLGGVALLGLVLAVVAVQVPEQRVLLFNLFLTFGALTVALDLLVGSLGMLSAGHAAFFGAGAYLSTIFSQRWGWPLPLAAATAVIAVAVLAAAIGYASVTRTAGMHFAIITFAFGQLMVEVVNQFPEITGGSEGQSVSWGLDEDLPFDWSIYRYFSLWLVGALVLTAAVVVALRRSQFGLRMQSIKDDEAVTKALGFNPRWYKAVAFVVASGLAGLIGTLYAPMTGFVSPQFMGVDQSVFFLGLIIVGGLGRVSGALIGVLLVAIIPLYLELDAVTRPLIVGVTMALVVLFEPNGVAGIADRIRRLAARSIGGRRSSDGPGAGPVGEPDRLVSTHE